MTTKKIGISNGTTIRGIIITLFAAVCWGFSGTCSEFLFTFKQADSAWLSMVRMLSSGTVLIIFMLAKGRGEAFRQMLVSRHQLLRLLAFSVFGLMLTQYSYLVAIFHTNSGTATVLQYIAPVFILVWACVSGHRLPKVFEAAAMAMVLFGVFMLATNGNPANLVLSQLGLFWGIIAAITLALYSVLPIPLIYRHGSIPVTALAMLFGGLVFSILKRPFHSDLIVDFSSLLALLGLVVLGTICAFTLYLYGIHLIGPVKGSIIASVEPVSAALFSHFWLGTVFSFEDVIGFAAILGAVLILSLKKTSSQ